MIAPFRTARTRVSAAMLMLLMLTGIALLLTPTAARAEYEPTALVVGSEIGGAASGDSAFLRVNAQTGAPIGAVSSLGASSVALGSAISPDGRTGYVARLLGDGAGGGDVVPIDMATGMIGVPLGFPSNPYYDVVVAPDGGTVYAIEQGNGDLFALDLAAGTTKTIPAAGWDGVDALGVRPLAISADGATLYVLSGTNVALVDTATFTVIGTENLGGLYVRAVSIGLTGNDDALWIAGYSAGESRLVYLSLPVGTGGTFSTFTFTDNVDFARFPMVAHPGGVLGASQEGVGPYASQLRSHDGTATLWSNDVALSNYGEGVNAVAVTPGGSRALHGDATAGEVVVRNLADGSFVNHTAVAGVDTITSIAVAPNQAPNAALAALPAQAVGQATAFDASGSSDDDSVARYDWDFGDGTTAANAGATPTHSYAAPGTYTVRVTVTDAQGCSTSYVGFGRTAWCNGLSSASTTRTVTVTKRASDLQVTCQPEAIQLGETAVCTGTVVDLSPAPTVRPTGTVTFSITGPGTLSAPSCELPASGPTACSVTLTASATSGGTTSLSASYAGDVNYVGTGSVSGGGLVTVPSATRVTTSIRKLITMAPGRTLSVPCRLDNATLKRCTAVLRDSRGRVLGRASRTVKIGDSKTTLRLRLNKHGRARLLGAFPGIGLRLTVTATQQFGAPTLRTTVRTKLRPRVALVRQARTGQFIGDSAWAKDTAKRWAKRTAPQLKGARRVVCNGYTAGTVNSAFARRLAHARALEMCLLLKRYGMKAPFTLKARGNANPVASNRTERGRILNRRVELQVYR